MEWAEGALVWFDPGVGHSLPGEVMEYHKAAQVLIIQAVINGKVGTDSLLTLYICNVKLGVWSRRLCLEAPSTNPLLIGLNYTRLLIGLK